MAGDTEYSDTEYSDTEYSDTEHLGGEYADHRAEQRFEYYLNNNERAEEDTDDSSEASETEAETDVTALTLHAMTLHAESALPLCNCIKRIMADGSERGCGECDEHWDMPSLVDCEEADIAELMTVETQE